MSPNELLHGKVCVVTGGGRGIGVAIAATYAEEGATIVLTAWSEDELRQVDARK